MHNKILAITLISIIIASNVAGCNSKETINNKQNTIQKESDKEDLKENKTKLTILTGTNWPVPPNTDPNNNKWANIYSEAFPNVDFEWIIVPSNTLAEKKNILMGSGDFPDLLGASQSDMINWSKQDLIIPLDDLIKTYMPNLKDYITEKDMKIGQYDGKQWLLPTPHNSAENPAPRYIRKDWLDSLNLEIPETLDDAFEVMKAFTYDDPDKNGKQDTFGIGGSKNLDMLWDIFMAFDVSPTYWSRVNGKLIPDMVRSEMKDALAFINKLYEAGVYDKESLAMEFSQVEEKATAGKYGTVAFWSFGMNGRINPAVKEKFDGKFIALKPFSGYDGYRGLPRGANIGDSYAITVACEKPEIPIQILNWLLEKDKQAEYETINADKIAYGEVGVHSEVVGNYINEFPSSSLSDEARVDDYRFSYRLMYGLSHIVTDKYQIKRKQGLVDAGIMDKGYVTDAKILSQYAQYNDKYISGTLEAEYMQELTTYFDEIKMKIITGNENIKKFDDWVEYFYKNHGQEIVEEVNKLNP